MNPERAVAYRKQVSGLLEAMLADEISPRMVLNCWPMFCNEDSSVKCAYTMVWFFEADEERHHLEMFYADLQLKAIREAYQFLKKGEPLPAATLKTYDKYHAPSEYQARWTWLEPIWWLRKQLATILSILEANPAFQLLSTKSKRPR